MDKLINISEAALIAIHALAAMAGSDESMSTHELAVFMGVSANHLSKVLQMLHRSGYISSVRGPAGGYRLAKSPDQITIKDILEVIEGPLPTGHCLFSSSKCHRKACVFGDMAEVVNRKIIDTLSNTTLSDFSKKENKNG